jgi:hypothetical protein
MVLSKILHQMIKKRYGEKSHEDLQFIFEAQYTFEENDYFDFTKQNCQTFNKT